jgi:hypothetical protein
VERQKPGRWDGTPSTVSYRNESATRVDEMDDGTIGETEPADTVPETLDVAVRDALEQRLDNGFFGSTEDPEWPTNRCRNVT